MRKAIRDLRKGEVFFYWSHPNGSEHGVYKMVGVKARSRDWGNTYDVLKHRNGKWAPCLILSGHARKVSSYGMTWPND